MSQTLQPGDVLDGYQIVRQIGAGGFGTVWLCKVQVTGDYRALKLVSAADQEILQKERDALIRYRQAASLLRSPYLMPIEHVNSNTLGLFYVMPLADGHGADNPSDDAWRPTTLSAIIAACRSESEWFSSRKIITMIRPVLEGLQILLDAGLVHRDVKPDNILFLDHHPCLADISLLGEDAHLVTRRGTPGYSAPSWYLDAGGHADMYGAAATLYTLLTGNAPDKMGRPQFRWPPQGEVSLTADQREEWLRLHRVVLRATEERPANRFLTYRAFIDALEGGDEPKLRQSVLPEVPTSAPFPSASGELTEAQRADYAATASLAAIYFDQKNYASALELVNHLLATYPVARQNPLYPTLRIQCLFALDRREEAHEELKKSLADDPVDAGSFTQRMQMWEALGDLEGAEAEATRILREKRPITLYHFMRGKVRLQRGNFTGVEEDIHAASTLDNDPSRVGLADKLRSDFAEMSPAYRQYLIERGTASHP